MNQKKQIERLGVLGQGMFIGIILAFFIGSIINLFEEEEFNSDEHICESYWYGACIVEDLGADNWEYCHNTREERRQSCAAWRPKTPQELQTDHCNKNPNDSEQCFCEEEDYLIPDTHFKFQLVSPYMIYCSKEEPTKCVITNISLTCIKARSKTECEKGNEDWVEEEVCNVGCIVNGTQLSYEECCYQHKTTCREKTECEKGNNNYIHDGKCYGEITENTKYIETRLECSTGWQNFCREKNKSRETNES